MAMAEEQQGSSGGGQSPMNLLKMMPGPMGQIADFKENAKKYGRQYAQQMAQKMAMKVAKQVAQKVATSILTNPYVLAAIGIAIAVIVVFLIIVSVVTNQTSSSDYSSIQPEATPGQTLTCDNGDYATCLKEQFNVVVTNGSARDLSRIYSSLSFAGQSKKYVELLKNGSQLTINMNYLGIGGCWGERVGNTIQIHNALVCAFVKETSFRHLLIHETGHIIIARNTSLVRQTFTYEDFKNTPPDSACYIDGILRSYNLRDLNSDYQRKDESTAEAISNALAKATPSIFSDGTINDFPNECPATYNWAVINIYGGFKFF